MNVSFSELLLILAVALLIFGPDKLPEIGKNLGRALRTFRSATSDLQRELRTSLDIDDSEKKTAEAGDAADTPALPPPPPPVFAAGSNAEAAPKPTDDEK